MKPGGNVGIGTSDPSNPLTIAGNASDAQFVLGMNVHQNTNDGGYGIGFAGTHGSAAIGLTHTGSYGNTWLTGELADSLAIKSWGAMQFGTSNDNIRMTISTSGTVGIGTTEPSSAYIMDVAGNVKIGSAGASIESSTGKYYGNGSALTNITATSISDGAITGQKMASDISVTTTGIVTAAAFSTTGDILLPSTSAIAGSIKINGTRVLHEAGYQGIFVGPDSGNMTIAGVWNSGLGYQTLKADTTGAENTAVGFQALTADTTGSQNTAIGGEALTSITTGEYNTAVGRASLSSNVLGSNNTAIGYSAGLFNTGSGNVFVGYNAGAFETSSNLLYIDNSSTSTPLVYGDFDNNYIRINGSLEVNSSNASKIGGGSWNTYSDARLKDILGTYDSGSDKVLKLVPVRYQYKKDNALNIPSDGEHIGLIAQEVQKLIPEAVTKGKGGYLSVNNDPIIWAMLNAIKEQQEKISDLESRLSILEHKN